MKFNTPIALAYLFSFSSIVLVFYQFTELVDNKRYPGGEILLLGIQLILPFAILFFISKDSAKQKILNSFTILTALIFIIGISSTGDGYFSTEEGAFHSFFALALPFCSLFLYSYLWGTKKVEYQEDQVEAKQISIYAAILKYAARAKIDDFNNTYLRDCFKNNYDWYVYGFLEGISTIDFFAFTHYSEGSARDFIDAFNREFKSLSGFQLKRLSKKFSKLRTHPINRYVDSGILLMVAALQLQGCDIESFLENIRYASEKNPNVDEHSPQIDGPY